MKNFVVLSYGRKSEYHRALFAIFSFWSWYSGRPDTVQTILYTDAPEFFEPYLRGLPVVYVPLTPERLADMCGPDHYVHRVKVTLVEEAFRSYPKHDILYSDTDAFFVRDPASLLQEFTPGVSFLHQPEYLLSEAVAVFASYGQAQFPSRFLELLQSKTFLIAGKQVQLLTNQPAWNSGVIGLSNAAAPLLPDIGALTDELYAYSRWFTTEQLAFTLVLQHQTTLLPCDQYVFHYWGKRQKVFVDGLLRALLTEGFRQSGLSDKLERVKHLTQLWQNRIELDRLQEGSIYAFNNQQVKAGLKYTLKALLKGRPSAYYVKRLLALARCNLSKAA